MPVNSYSFFFFFFFLVIFASSVTTQCSQSQCKGSSGSTWPHLIFPAIAQPAYSKSAPGAQETDRMAAWQISWGRGNLLLDSLNCCIYNRKDLPLKHPSGGTSDHIRLCCGGGCSMYQIEYDIFPIVYPAPVSKPRSHKTQYLSPTVPTLLYPLISSNPPLKIHLFENNGHVITEPLKTVLTCSSFHLRYTLISSFGQWVWNS